MRGGPGLIWLTGAIVACRAVPRPLGRATRIGTACVALVAPGQTGVNMPGPDPA